MQGADGANPEFGLTLSGSGNLFGTAYSSAVYHLRAGGTGWTFSPIYDFNGSNGGFVAGRLTFGN